MRKTVIRSALVVALSLAATTASAQYYQLINQLTDMVGTAMQGGANYRGLVDVSYLTGVGHQRAQFTEVTTTQGVKYGDLFYMGVGAGVSFMNTAVNNGYYQPDHGTTQNAVMIPLYTDFRFNFGKPQSVGFYIDLRAGAGFYVSDKYIVVGDGYINTQSSFYLKPGVGVRVPVSKGNPKLALNVNATYQLLTNSYWYNPGSSRNITLNSVGLNIGFEW